MSDANLPLGTRRIWSDGYAWIKVGPGKTGWKREHQIVAERQLGRRLKRGEEPHHKNCIRSDNRSSNIVVLTKARHARLHQTGRKASATTRRKMRAAGKGRPKSAEHRRKIGLAHRGKKVSAGTCRKLAARVFTPIWRKRISIAMKNRRIK